MVWWICKLNKMKNLDLTIREIHDEEIPMEALQGTHTNYLGRYKKEPGEHTPRPNKSLILINNLKKIIMLAHVRESQDKNLSNMEVEYDVIDLIKPNLNINYSLNEIIKKFKKYFKDYHKTKSVPS